MEITQSLLKESLQIREDILALRDTAVLTKKDLFSLQSKISVQLEEFANNITV
jgi:hypothetical protein